MAYTFKAITTFLHYFQLRMFLEELPTMLLASGSSSMIILPILFSFKILVSNFLHNQMAAHLKGLSRFRYFNHSNKGIFFASADIRSGNRYNLRCTDFNSKLPLVWVKMFRVKRVHTE
jgi:hypothetical protein